MALAKLRFGREPYGVPSQLILWSGRAMGHYARLREVRLQTVIVAPTIRFTLVMSGPWGWKEQKRRSMTATSTRVV